MMTPKVNQEVNTPNGRGVYQFPCLTKDGERVAMVAHTKKLPSTVIVTGLWQLKEYQFDELEAVS